MKGVKVKIISYIAKFLLQFTVFRSVWGEDSSDSVKSLAKHMIMASNASGTDRNCWGERCELKNSLQKNAQKTSVSR